MAGLIISFLGVISIFQYTQEGNEGSINDISEYIFKPVNHFYSYTWTRARVKFYGPFKKYFCIWSQDTKKSMFSATIFLSPSSHFEEPHQSHHRDGCQATHINSFLISAFCALCF